MAWIFVEYLVFVERIYIYCNIFSDFRDFGLDKKIPVKWIQR